MSIKEMTCKTALHYHDHAFASNWDLNIYRGCGHRCIYCFAQYSHRYLNTIERLEMIGKLIRCEIPCGVLMMPIIPHLTDNIENLDAIFRLAKENGAKTIIPQLLHL